MSVSGPVHRLMLSENNWTVTNHGTFRNMVAKVDGAGLRYIHPGSGRTVTKNFVRGSVVMHRPSTNTISYVDNDVIPLVDEFRSLAGDFAELL